MRGVCFGFLLFFLVGCGTRQWPATITSMQGFSPTQMQQIQSAISDLNSTGKRPLITTEAGPRTYPISVSLVDPTQATENRAGCATVSGSQCVVQLSSLLFEDEYADDLESVVWHELGHCAGLVHVPQQGEVMFAYTIPFSTYSSDALSRFLTSITSSAGL